MEAATAPPSQDPAGQVVENDPGQAGDQPTSPPDVSEQLAALGQRLEAVQNAVAPPPEPRSTENLYQSLYQEAQEPEAPQPTYGDPQQGQVPQQQQPNAGQQQPMDEQAMFDHYVRERVAEAVNQTVSPMFQQQGLEQLEGRYEDITEPEMVEAIAGRLAPLSQKFGNDSILTDPGLVEAMYLAEKASRAQPTQPVEGGAVLESGGASSPQPEMDSDEQIKAGILGIADGKDAFT